MKQILLTINLILFSLLIITDALSSKRNLEPSFRRADCFVRTITALTTSERFTAKFGVASLTTPIWSRHDHKHDLESIWQGPQTHIERQSCYHA